ncbi:hypothetical protein C1X61_07160 [Pseudomonas sp. FW215-T2]|nr:hypothetical protein C1X61_07160 [Pseudomonas sp. FW215-T2]
MSLAGLFCAWVFVLAGLASSRASSLPQGVCGECDICVRHKTIVGASLLAKTVCLTPNKQRPINIGFGRRTIPTVTCVISGY